MIVQTVSGFKVVVGGNIETALPSPSNIPWWDLGDLGIAAAEKLKGWLFHQFDLLGLWVHEQCINFLDVALPTLACVGIIWWMCPFAPKSEKAPKLTGLALLVYMFYSIAKGV